MGSPTKEKRRVNLSVDPVQYVLGHESVPKPILYREEYFEVLKETIDRIKPFLRDLCTETFEKQLVDLPSCYPSKRILKPHIFAIKDKEKCIFLKLKVSYEGKREYSFIVITRNGGIFVLSYDKPDKIEDASPLRLTYIREALFRPGGELVDLEIKRLIYALNEGLRKSCATKSNNAQHQAHVFLDQATWHYNVTSRLP